MTQNYSEAKKKLQVETIIENNFKIKILIKNLKNYKRKKIKQNRLDAVGEIL